MCEDKKMRNKPKNPILREKIAQERYVASGELSDSKYHGHNFYEFTICTGGRFSNSYGNEQAQEMKKGMIYFSRPGEMHQIVGEGDEFVYDNVYVTKEKMERLCKALSKNLFQRINEVDGPIVCSLDYDKLKRLSMNIKKFSSFVEIDEVDEAEHSLIITGLIEAVAEKYLFKRDPELPQWLEEIVELISRKENFTVSLGTLLSKSYYSRAYISIAFKRYLGETIVEYRNRLRVKYSLELLSRSDVSVNEVANALGWENTNNYIIAFKKVYGITPLQYKNARLKSR